MANTNADIKFLRQFRRKTEFGEQYKLEKWMNLNTNPPQTKSQCELKLALAFFQSLELTDHVFHDEDSRHHPHTHRYFTAFATEQFDSSVSDET